MKRSISSLLIILATVSSYAQAKFESGYFISNDGQRVACQIRIMEWSESKFEYRMGDGADTKAGSIDDAKEFGVDNGLIFRRFEVKIDRSSEELSRLDFKRNPVFEDAILFLQVLVEGKASLFQYKQGEMFRFFYTVDQAPIQQLVNKRYMATSTQATYNDMFRQQLYNDLKCSSISQKDMERMRYDAKDLSKIFVVFNECNGTVSSIVVKEPDKKTVYHLALRLATAYNSLNVSSSLPAGGSLDFGSHGSYRVGLEIESILPFQEGVWSLTIEPVFQSYSTEINYGGDKIDYKSIDFNIGVRRRFLVRDNSYFFVGGAFVYSLPMSSTIKSGGLVFNISTGLNFALAAGYSRNRFSAEINYGFSRGLLGDYASFNSSYKGPALVVGFRLF